MSATSSDAKHPTLAGETARPTCWDGGTGGDGACLTVAGGSESVGRKKRPDRAVTADHPRHRTGDRQARADTGAQNDWFCASMVQDDPQTANTPDGRVFARAREGLGCSVMGFPVSPRPRLAEFTVPD